MRSVQSWLDEYGDSHQNKFNKLVHWICVPSIMFSIFGLLWSLQFPAIINSVIPLLNWSIIFVLLTFIFYLFLSARLAIGMIIVSGIMLTVIYWIDGLWAPLWMISLGIFLFAWLGQFIGHMVEGRKPSFLKDLQFLLIGPLWLLAAVYRKLGIRY